MKIQDITSIIEDLAPLAYQEDYDNSGLNVGNMGDEVKAALVCLDCTEEVVDEAVTLGANLIISHHPLIFGGLQSINTSHWLGKTITKAIKNDITIYAAHTNLDNVKNGVNGKIASKIGLVDPKILVPSLESKEVGAGMIGELNDETSIEELLKLIQKEFNAQGIRHTKILKEQIKKIAICGGSGSFLLQQAIEQNADVFITGDFKYHQFFEANEEIVIIDIGHHESEQFTSEIIHGLIKEKFPKFAIHFSKTNTNPIKYLI